ncbi:MAG: ferrous iron transport protein B [Bacteroidetes bacterium]|jgi:ferrous iron transport protein B|nr:ferrous iron transport protein B [Bacteroidota bacterium]MBT4398955.1 ferrous iron transport protein B [Bacteroidota bacterium]MBT4409614.1 ferrous iron transport protein B [Bacteroidota bacterium]MBT5427729.1 ferrous iron transport protein B [Bacteroidota bacterium]MBT7463043.1 ferrous iron transport protein B [Bacteroidota bacterium]
MTLAELKTGEKAVISKIKGRGTFRKRIMEMGFVKGKVVRVVKSAPLKDPIEYQILNYNISLRRAEAALVEVVRLDTIHEKEFKTTEDEPRQISEKIRQQLKERGQHIEVALVGNPNSGKTSIFNIASHSREHVGNYAGVTVDSKKANFKQNEYNFQLTDLPGTYSITAYSPEELYVRKYLMNEYPDVVLNVIDASNLERNLFLTSQLIDMDQKVVIALNMYDELEKRGDTFDYGHLGKMFGIPIIPTVARNGEGIEELFDTVIAQFEDEEPITRHVHINYGKEVERSISRLQTQIRGTGFSYALSSRFFATKLLEKDQDISEYIQSFNPEGSIQELADKEIRRLENLLSDDTEELIADARFGFISGALKETLKEKQDEVEEESTPTARLDRILTNKWLGFPLFLLFLWLMFQTTFSVGQFPVSWIESGVSLLSTLFTQLLPSGIFQDLVVDGIIGGVGGVIIFLPNILILFLFISFMEDTGYMARVAFIMDKLMHMIGLHGKSFIPLIMGFGCNVPAIMATRTLENKRDRLLTMLIIPLMSCSARLPVYILIAGAIFPGQAGNIIFGLYMTGILLSVLVALVLKNTLFRKQESPFVMELPPYRVPTAQAIFKHMWFKGQIYLKKMGGLILIASIIIWALGYFPRVEGNKTEQLENSYIGKIGKTVEPVIKPLGFDWKMGIALITGTVAKEVVVSTLGVLYQDDEASDNLPDKIRTDVYQTGPRKGQTVYTPHATLAFLLFVLIYVPCIAVLAVIRKESGGWKWAIFMAVYTTALAWIIAFGVFQIGSLLA